MAQNILVIHGPNLNLLGTREPHIYGSTTMTDVNELLTTRCSALDPSASVCAFQSNHEGAIIDRIHEARTTVDAIIINAGGLTHTSVALRDALVAVDIPFVEVHVSNVHAREEFRAHSYLSEKAVGVVVGLGVYGYVAALEFVVQHLAMRTAKS